MNCQVWESVSFHPRIRESWRRKVSFYFVASDPVRSVRLVQDRHLESIRAASFLWLVCPDGYVGQSASQELGYATALRVPIFATRPPTDLTLRQYVTVVPTLAALVEKMRSNPPRETSEGLLIDPRASVERAHSILDQIGTMLTRPGVFDEPEKRLRFATRDLRATLTLPS